MQEAPRGALPLSTSSWGGPPAAARLPRSPREPTNRQNPAQRLADRADAPARPLLTIPAGSLSPSTTATAGCSVRPAKAVTSALSGGTSSSGFRKLCHGVREELPVKEAILDGEVVALDSDGRQNFRHLLAGQGNLHYPLRPLWRDQFGWLGR